jgi:hypothetical protein
MTKLMTLKGDPPVSTIQANCTDYYSFISHNDSKETAKSKCTLQEEPHHFQYCERMWGLSETDLPPFFEIFIHKKWQMNEYVLMELYL